jgi:hypothetical protein
LSRKIYLAIGAARAARELGVRKEFRQTSPTIILITIAFGGLGFIIQGAGGGVVSTLLVFFAAVIVAAFKG